jgi:hypothetical protein
MEFGWDRGLLSPEIEAQYLGWKLQLKYILPCTSKHTMSSTAITSSENMRITNCVVNQLILDKSEKVMLIIEWIQAYFIQHGVWFWSRYTHYTSALVVSNRLSLTAPSTRISTSTTCAGHDSHFTDVMLRRQEYMDFTRASICTLDVFIVAQHANPRYSVQQWGNSKVKAVRSR